MTGMSCDGKSGHVTGMSRDGRPGNVTGMSRGGKSGHVTGMSRDGRPGHVTPVVGKLVFRKNSSRLACRDLGLFTDIAPNV